MLFWLWSMLIEKSECSWSNAGTGVMFVVYGLFLLWNFVGKMENSFVFILLLFIFSFVDCRSVSVNFAANVKIHTHLTLGVQKSYNCGMCVGRIICLLKLSLLYAEFFWTLFTTYISLKTNPTNLYGLLLCCD